MRLYRTTKFQRALFPSLVWSEKSEDTIYLTFDDGPTEMVTPWVLDELDRVDGKATFFCLGKNLERNERIAKEILRRDHAIGNHSYEHLNGWKTNLEVYVADVEKCDDPLSELNVKTPLFRPPYGKLTRSQVRKLNKKKIVMWSYLAWDFAELFEEEKALRALKKAGPGDIVLFHDSQKAFSNLKKILPELLSHYCEQGLSLGVLK